MAAIHDLDDGMKQGFSILAQEMDADDSGFTPQERQIMSDFTNGSENLRESPVASDERGLNLSPPNRKWAERLGITDLDSAVAMLEQIVQNPELTHKLGTEIGNNLAGFIKTRFGSMLMPKQPLGKKISSLFS